MSKHPHRLEKYDQYGLAPTSLALIALNNDLILLLHETSSPFASVPVKVLCFVKSKVNGCCADHHTV